ncbi:MAG: choice-of-anchor J domain-containing protein, partial [Muribaculaceae bacterium]|nr:choice-of-anchor J domain-containing protein [Muribaculaceae bacterium]
MTAIGLSSKAQTASDSYLDIANYATIDQAGWNHSLVNKLYTYDSESRWLKLSMYGAFVGAKYSTTSTTFNSGSPQKWIATSITQSNQCGNTTWNATDVFLGSSNYFTGTAKAVGTNSTSSRTDKSVTFYVTNTTDVKLYGSQATNSTTYPTTLKVYECDKSLNANSTVTTQGSLTTSGAGTISLTGLDATKIYKVVASQARGYIYEIAFQTPPPTIIAEPASVTFDNAEITYTYTKTVTVKGLNLLQGITASISGSSDFSIDNTSLNAKGGTITVTYSPQAVGSTQATLTLSNADAEDVSIPISGTAQPMKPHNLMINDVTAYTANASWESANNATSYNLRYRKVLGYNPTFSESFENGFTGWTLIDNDGDGNNWTQFNPENFTSGAFEAHDGDYGAMSRSWMSNPLTPDNWLISPQVDLGGVLKYYIIDDGGYQETYRVYVSTTGTNISDFVPLTDDLLSPGSNSWTEMTISLSAYEGQRGYIAFRNYNCTDEDFMMIDAVSIDAMTYGDWVEVNNVSSPYTITGLDPETDYVAQVQAVYNTGNSDWTPSVLFTTSSANALPIDLTVNNVTDNSADASWYGSQDNYNLRYRKVLGYNPTF